MEQGVKGSPPVAAVRFVDLPAAFAEIREGLDALWARACSDCQFVGGPLLEGFEEDFARYCDAGFCVGVASGTEALRLALEASGIGPGDEVLTLANTYFATAAAISAVGATPVFVDPSPDDLLMAASALEARIGPRSRAVIPVHLYGSVCDMSAIEAVARRHDLIVIEDGCQAHGARRDGMRVGASGHPVCFSFYPGKNLGGVGEGGAVVGRDPALAERLRRLRAHGQDRKNHHVELGLNGHLDALSAGVLSLRLPLLDEWNARRRHWAARYDEAFDGWGFSRLVVPEGVESVRHLYPLAVSNPERLRAFLGEAAIESGCHYPIPVPLQPAYASLAARRDDFPVATGHGEGHVTLPMHPHLSEGQMDRILDRLDEVRRRAPDLFFPHGAPWGTRGRAAR